MTHGLSPLLGNSLHPRARAVNRESEELQHPAQTQLAQDSIHSPFCIFSEVCKDTGSLVTPHSLLFSLRPDREEQTQAGGPFTHVHIH